MFVRPAMHLPHSRIVLAVFFAALFARGLAAPATPAAWENFGQVKAMRVIGDVTAQSSDESSPVPLHNGDLLFEGYAITTPANASVVLVFSNGSTVRVQGNSRLELSRFRQDPLKEDTVKVDELKAEPSTSQVELKLGYGEIIGEVKKLSASSSYSVQTSIGAAGIRGTVFRDQYRTEGGVSSYAFATTEGLVEFTDLAGHKSAVPAGRVLGGRQLANKPPGAAAYRVDGLPARASRAIQKHIEVMRLVRTKVVFRRQDAHSLRKGKPKLRQEPNGKRDDGDDERFIKREKAAKAAPVRRAKK